MLQAVDMRNAFFALSLVACTTLDPATDERDAAFVGSGKADGTIADGSADALGVLAVVNTLDEAALDVDVSLDARAARGIAMHRAGADGADGTADDDRFDTLGELDAVPYVGPVAFARLLDYAQAHGFVGSLTKYQTPIDPSISAGFAHAIDVSGSTLVVSADDGYPGNGGAVHVYERSGGGWKLQTTLRPPTELAWDYGSSVAIDGDTIAATMMEHRPPAPGMFRSVRVMTRDGSSWRLQAILDIDKGNYELPGTGLVLAGDTLIVRGKSTTRGIVGALQVFERTGTTWTKTATLESPSTTEFSFGQSFALAGNTLVAGSFRSSGPHLVGAIDVYERNGAWTHVERIDAPSELANGAFGQSIACDGTTLVVGAGDADAAVVYTRSGSSWTRVATLGGAGSGVTPLFGGRVAVDGNQIAVGVPPGYYDSMPGGVHLFERGSTGWQETGRIEDTTQDHLGRNVVLKDGWTLVTSWSDGANEGVGAFFSN